MSINGNLIRALEPNYYINPDIFAREKQTLLAMTWQFAGHVSQVRNIGDYFTFEIAGENLFCMRGNDGEIRAFYNVCQHRAHELLKGEGNARKIVCPYHAWTYELSGELFNGPNLDSLPEFDKSKICLVAVRVEDFHGFLFVNLDNKAKPMEEWFPNVREELLAYVPNILELEPLEWIVVPEKCNWKVAIENYSECYHCSMNHKTFVNSVIKPQTYDIQPQGYCLRHTTESQNLDQMSYEIDLNANPNADKYSSWFLWPLFSFQVFPGNVLNTYHWRAIKTDEVIVWRGWYTIGGQKCESIRKLAVQDRQTTFEEDISLVESVQRGLGSRGYSPGPLVLDPKFGLNSEHSIQALHHWFRERVA